MTEAQRLAELEAVRLAEASPELEPMQLRCVDTDTLLVTVMAANYASAESMMAIGCICGCPTGRVQAIRTEIL